MLIHILYEFKEGPWGGGNQFLKSLRTYFTSLGVYVNSPDRADVILFNSHHSINEVLTLKRKWPTKIFIHRVDGPVFLVRGSGRNIDKLIFFVNNLLADATVFQSAWSREKCYQQGMENVASETVIVNSPDPDIFNYSIKAAGHIIGEKIKLIATSWSPNIRKGFDVYKYLDTHLDFNRYEMTFIGNSPVTFKNILHVAPLSSIQLASELKKHDIFITASTDDPCSNSLIEALHCGLPAVVRNSGGHPEIVGTRGEVFQGGNDICEVINGVANDYHMYKERILLHPNANSGEQYLKFIRDIYTKSRESSYRRRTFTFFSFGKAVFLCKILG